MFSVMILQLYYVLYVYINAISTTVSYYSLELSSM